MSAPKHRFELTLTMGANDFGELMARLKALEFDIRDRPSGGYIGHGEEPKEQISIVSSVPYTLKIDVQPDVTEESYRVALTEYIQEIKRQRAEGGEK